MAEQTANQLADQLLRNYYASAFLGEVSTQYSGTGLNVAHALKQGNQKIQTQGMANLYSMLRNQGRMDPRILARQQAANSMSTQRQQDAARAGATRSGFGRGGLNQAIQGAIGSAGANRAADFNYRDIADSYQRNQQNLGLMGQLITQPSIDYAALGSNQYNSDRSANNQQTSGYAGAIAALIGAFV